MHWIKPNILLLTLFVLCFSKDVKAQDPVYSQFYTSALDLNPAMTGIFNGQYRVALNYREQWSSILNSVPFRTIGASADFRVHVVNDDFFTIGLKAMRDEVGIGNFSQSMGHLSTGFMKRLSSPRYRKGDQFLVGGLQLGFGQNSVEWGKLWFGRQFDLTNQTIDYSIPTGEINETLGRTRFYLDINLGVLWYLVYDEYTSIYAGFAMNHINAPNISFIENGSEELFRRYTFHAGGEIKLVGNLSILPAAMWSFQGPSMQINTGANFRYTHRDWREIAVRAGVWNRVSKRFEGFNMDAIIFTTILELETWNLGLSYDVTTSALARANQSRGAFELSLIYVFPYTYRRSFVRCPKL